MVRCAGVSWRGILLYKHVLFAFKTACLFVCLFVCWFVCLYFADLFPYVCCILQILKRFKGSEKLIKKSSNPSAEQQQQQQQQQQRQIIGECVRVRACTFVCSLARKWPHEKLIAASCRRCLFSFFKAALIYFKAFSTPHLRDSITISSSQCGRLM